jgi:hypothetical protein
MFTITSPHFLDLLPDFSWLGDWALAGILLFVAFILFMFTLVFKSRLMAVITLCIAGAGVLLVLRLLEMI